MTRRITALLCAFVMLLSLAACAPHSATDNMVSPTDTADISLVPPTMPVVRINTDDGGFDFATQPTREDKLRDAIEYVGATVSVEGCDEQYAFTDAAAQVKARGNYTLDYPKKAIRIKFDEKQGMLGLNDGQEFKNWVLLAEWKDLSMCNNATAFYLAEAILGADGYYCTDFLNVELYINNTYWGVYLLVEQQEVKKGRTSVSEVEDDYTGTDIGYFFEYDGYYLDERRVPNGGGDPTFEINYGSYADGKPGHVVLEGYNTDGMHGYTVKSDINSDEQLDFIASYLENTYKILYSAVCEDKHYAFNESCTALVPADGKTTREVVSEVIDLQSLVDIYLLNEIVINPDIGWSSFFMSVDMSEQGSHKLIFEAPWDFDSCFGIRAGWEQAVGMYVRQSQNPWMCLLHEEDWFMDMVEDKWAQLKENGVPETAIERVRAYKTVYAEYYARNYERWEERIIYGNHELVPQLNSCQSQDEAADYLCNWLHKRFNYLDHELS